MLIKIWKFLAKNYYLTLYYFNIRLLNNQEIKNVVFCEANFKDTNKHWKEKDVEILDS